jgi:hypothetical protein
MDAQYHRVFSSGDQHAVLFVTVQCNPQLHHAHSTCAAHHSRVYIANSSMHSNSSWVNCWDASNASAMHMHHAVHHPVPSRQSSTMPTTPASLQSCLFGRFHMLHRCKDVPQHHATTECGLVLRPLHHHLSVDSLICLIVARVNRATLRVIGGGDKGGGGREGKG